MARVQPSEFKTNAQKRRDYYRLAQDPSKHGSEEARRIVEDFRVISGFYKRHDKTDCTHRS